MRKFIIYYYYYVTYLLNIQWNIFKSKSPTEVFAYKTMLYVLRKHHSVGQKYNDLYPYYYHLKMVSEFANKFRHLLSSEDSYTAFMITLLHDIIEDCRLTYNDVKELFGVEVADGVFACTELRGKNRKERHGPIYYKGLQEHRLGRYGKLCDITANMTMGKRTGSSMLTKYRKEYAHTKSELFTDEFKEIFDYIEANLMND